MRERDIREHHDAVRREADAARADERTLYDARSRALDRADRREWSQRKFAVGGEYRWRETLGESVIPTRRRFIYDPKQDAVVEIY